MQYFFLPQSFLVICHPTAHTTHIPPLSSSSFFCQKARLSPNEVKEIQLKLQHKEAALQTAEKEILALHNLLTQKTFSYTTKTKGASVVAAQALAVTEAALVAATREAATAVSGREKALASLQVSFDVFARFPVACHGHPLQLSNAFTILIVADTAGLSLPRTL